MITNFANEKLKRNNISFPLYGVILNDDNMKDINFLFDSKQMVQNLPALYLEEREMLDKEGRADHYPYLIYKLTDTDHLKVFLTGGYNCIDLDFGSDSERYISLAQTWTWNTSPYLIDGMTKNATMIGAIEALGIPVENLYGRDAEYEKYSKEFSYEIWQLKDPETIDPETYSKIAFESFNRAQANGVDITSDLYEKVYEGNLDGHTFEDLYYRFNANRPNDFNGHSMAISDVIALYDRAKGNEYLGSFYVDSFGFESVPGFMTEDRTQDITHQEDIAIAR